jgi:hypothetical protein
MASVYCHLCADGDHFVIMCSFLIPRSILRSSLPGFLLLTFPKTHFRLPDEELPKLMCEGC